MLKMTLKRDEYILFHDHTEIDRINDEIFYDDSKETVSVLSTNEYGDLIFKDYRIYEMQVYERDFYERNIKRGN